MIRVGMAGIPACGKTYLSRAFSAFFKYKGKYLITEVISEYARTYISKYGSIDSIWEQYKIFDKQLEKEERLPKKTELLITDSPLQLAFHYTTELRNVSNSKDSMVLDDIFHKMNALNTPPRYDIIFHLPPVLEVINDGVRPPIHLDSNWRKEADDNIKYVCKTLFPPKKFVEVEPVPLNERVEFCAKILEEYISKGL